MSKELAKYGIKTVTNLVTAEELPVANPAGDQNGASLFSHSPAARIPFLAARSEESQARSRPGPDCLRLGLSNGLRVGSSQTLICDRCGARFNVMLPRFCRTDYNVMQPRLLPCPRRCDLPNPRLYKFGGSWNISCCHPRCGAKIWAATKSEAVAEWNDEPVNPALDA